MAVDRGGLQYSISVKDEFSKATQKFVSELALVREAFGQFKSDASGLAATNTRIAVSIDQTSRAGQRKTAQLSAEAEAERKLTRILRNRIVQDELRQIADRKGVQLGQRKARQLTVEQEAERRLQAQVRASAVARRVADQAAARGLDLSRRRVRQLTVEQEAQAKLDAVIRKRQVLAKTEELAQQAGIEVSKKKARQLSVEEEAIKRVADAERKRAIAARVQQLEDAKFIGPRLPPGGLPVATAGATPPGDAETLRGIALAKQRVDQFRTSLLGANDGGNDLLFTFRRLFGVLAAFQAARAIFTGFIDLIKSGIQFNATIERTRIGIASLILAVGTLRDAQGDTVEGADAFLLAQKEAVRQQKLLRTESLKTTATFEELLDTFQVAVGPGIGAGLNLDQVRKFSVQISQAASAIGVAQNQLSEEIRSILSGTIQQRTTRIAAVLGITNEDIRTAREAGNLFQFLQDRFQSFGIAGEEAAKTFDGLLGILKGAVQELAGLAAAPLFDTLRSTLAELVDLILTIGPDGAVIINPDAVLAIAPIFAGIQTAIDAIRESAGNIGFQDLTSSAQLIGAAIAVAGEVIAGVVRGIVSGFSIVVAILESIASAFGDQRDGLQDIVALVTKYSAVFGSVLLIVGLIGAALNAVLTPMRLLISLTTTLATGALNVLGAFSRLPSAIQLAFARIVFVLGIFLGLSEAVRQVTEGIFGVNLSLRQTVELISLGVLGAFVSVFQTVSQLAFVIKDSIGEAFRSAADAAVRFINEGKILIASLLGDQLEVQALTAAQEQTTLDQDNARLRRRKQAELELADLRAQQEAKSLAINQEIAKIVGEAAGADALGQIPSALEELLGSITRLFGDFDLGISNLFKDLENGGFDFDKFFNLDEFLAKLKAAQEEGIPGRQATIAPRGVPITDEQRRGLAEAQQKLALTQQQLQADRSINDLERQRASNDVIRLQELRNQLGELQTQIDTQRALNELEVEAAQRAVNGAVGEDQKLFLEQQLVTLKQQQVADEEALRVKIDETNIALERQQQIVSGTIGEGFGQGLQDFAQQFSSAFQAGIEISKGLLQSFSSFVSDSIVSAFDPNNDTSIKERFGQFLQDIARLILNQLIQLQIAKLLIGFGLGGPAPAGASTGGSIGLAEGGSIPNRGRASPAHFGFKARGLAIGGEATPPPGIDRRDTVPIWAQPGEFMQSLAAVRTYGRDFMEALNSRVLDPQALRGLAGLRSTRRMAVAARRGPGFQTGGLISEQIARQTAVQSLQATSPGGGSGGVQRAVVVAGEAEFDRLVSGGSGSLIRWMRENKDTVRGILDRG